MANMSYCRFQNTSGDLEDCLDAMETGAGDDYELSQEERRAKQRLIQTCHEIIAYQEEEQE